MQDVVADKHVEGVPLVSVVVAGAYVDACILHIAIPVLAVCIFLVGSFYQISKGVDAFLLEYFVWLSKDGESHLTLGWIVGVWILVFWFDVEPADALGADVFLQDLVDTCLSQGFYPEPVASHCIHLVDDVVG